MTELPIPTLMGLLGAVTGLVIGFTARRLRFCTLSAVESALYGDNWVQARMWALAIAVAALGTHLMHAEGLIDLGQSFHLLPRIAFAGPIIGGLLFGLGMASVGTCGFGALLRAGGGDMRAAMVVLTIAIFGYMTMRGLIGMGRIMVIDPMNVPLPDGLDASIASAVAMMTGAAPEDFRLASAVGVALLLGFWCLRDPAFRSNRAAIAGGMIVGLTAAFGWFATGYLGADDFDPQLLRSLGFVSPAGEALVYLMTFSGSTIDFGIGVIFGAVSGGFLAAFIKKETRLDAFDDPREMRRHLFGGALMGIGGVAAMGCTIGQGLSGVSTLALPSFLALASTLIGAVIGLKLLINGGPVMVLRTFWRSTFGAPGGR